MEGVRPGKFLLLNNIQIASLECVLQFALGVEIHLEPETKMLC